MALGQANHELAIERLGEARIGHRRREAVRGQILGRLQRFGQARAERQDRNARTLAQNAALADLQRHAMLGHFDADSVAARIAHRDRP